MNSPKAFRAERLSWRAVVQLNVVRSVRLVLDAIADQADAQALSLTPRSSTSSRDSQSQILTQSQVANLDATPTPTSNGYRNGNLKGLSNDHYAHLDDLMNDPDLMKPEHVQLRRRLLPLLDAEAVLLARLMPVAAASGSSLREIENSHAPDGASGSQSSLRHVASEKGLEEAVCKYPSVVPSLPARL